MIRKGVIIAGTLVLVLFKTVAEAEVENCDEFDRVYKTSSEPDANGSYSTAYRPANSKYLSAKEVQEIEYVSLGFFTDGVPVHKALDFALDTKNKSVEKSLTVYNENARSQNRCTSQGDSRLLSEIQSLIAKTRLNSSCSTRSKGNPTFSLYLRTGDVHNSYQMNVPTKTAASEWRRLLEREDPGACEPPPGPLQVSEDQLQRSVTIRVRLKSNADRSVYIVLEPDFNFASYEGVYDPKAPCESLKNNKALNQMRKELTKSLIVSGPDPKAEQAEPEVMLQLSAGKTEWSFGNEPSREFSSITGLTLAVEFAKKMLAPNCKPEHFN